RLNIELAKQEIRELLLRNGVAIGLLAFGALLFMLAVLVALPAFLVLLWSNHLAGALIWLGSYAFVGALLALGGRLRLRLQPLRRTLGSLGGTGDLAPREIPSDAKA